MPNDKLKLRFDAALNALGCDIDPAVRARLWQDIAARYGEPHRAYHTLEHLTQLFTHFERIYDALDQPHLIALALFYHDVIYDPKRSDNEVKSAEYAVSVLNSYLNKAHCARIYNLIMMTADHEPQDKKDTDAAYLLDMDLSILGADWSAYRQYAQAVRTEYAHIKDKDYQRGRINVLKGLLAHDPLYLTHKFAPLEPQARENIKREIDRL